MSTVFRRCQWRHARLDGRRSCEEGPQNGRKGLDKSLAQQAGVPGIDVDYVERVC